MSEKVYYKTHSGGNETQTKKFLDYEGVKYLWSKINMQDYPNNETLMAVINAIDETKMDNLENVIFSGEYTIQSGTINFPDLTNDIIGKIGVLYDNRHNILECNIIDSTPEPGTDHTRYPIWEGKRFSYYPYWLSDSGQDGWYTTLEDDTADQYTFSVISPLKDIYIPDTIARVSDIAQPDWKQNDSNNNSYIQNRTHWVENENNLEYLATESIVQNSQTIFSNIDFDEETEYVFHVKINNAVVNELSGKFIYTSYLPSTVGFVGHTLNGNPVVDQNTIYSEDNLKTLYAYNFSYPCELIVYKKKGEVIYHQLDEKFIPDTIARTHQVPEVYVQSVNGMIGDVVINIPQNIVTNDELHPIAKSGSWNDLIDKPFGEAEVNYFTVTINSNEMASSNINIYDLPLSEGINTYNCIIADNNNNNLGTAIMTVTGRPYASGNRLGLDVNIKHNEFELDGYCSMDEQWLVDLNILQNPGFGIGYQMYVYSEDLNITKDKTISMDEKYIPDTIARTSDIPEVPVKSVNGMTGDVVIDIPKGFSGSWNDLEDKPTTTKYQDELLILHTDLENEYYFNLPYRFHLNEEHTYRAYLKDRNNYGYITIHGYETTNTLFMDLIFKNSLNNILFTAHGESPDGKMRFTDLGDFNNETLIIYSGEELMDHMIPDTIARVSDIIQSDWEQNDETARNYIKNRPFYTEDPVKTVVFEEETVVVGPDLYVQCVQPMYVDVGRTYYVTFNGAEYECVAWKDKDYYNISCIGNGAFVDVENQGNGEPFLIEGNIDAEPEGCFLDSEQGEHTISISTMIETVHQLDIKYVPSDDRKMNVESPVCAGEFSMNRSSNSAIGNYSSTLGILCTATGDYSHAEGCATIAAGQSSHVQGKYNIEDSENKYAHIVGNGYSQGGQYIKSNAHTLDWNGNAWYQGEVYVGGTSQDNENATRLLKESEIATDDEIIDMLIEEDMVAAVTDSDGAVLADENNNILLW